MPINVAIIGCAKIAHLHAKAILQIPELSFKAVWSRTPGSAQKFVDEYGVKSYTSIPEMIKAENIQMTVICTAHPYHADPAIQAMEAGAHVLIEKPLASTLQDCDRIIEASHRTGRKTGVISQRRYYQPIVRMKKAIDEGKIGTPALGTIQMLGWRDRSYFESDAWRGSWAMEGGGVMVNQAPHPLDLLQWLMGDIDEVFGYWSNLNHPYIEVEDTAVAVIRFKNGGLGIFWSAIRKNLVFTEKYIFMAAMALRLALNPKAAPCLLPERQPLLNLRSSIYGRFRARST